MLELQKRNGLAGISPMGRDRRIAPRYSFTAEAEALDAHSRARMSARTSDISRGGCYVDTFCPFPKNSSVKIRMLRDNQALVADAKVVYSQLGMGMGLSFSAIDVENRQVLDAWIGELNGTTPIVFKDVARAEPIAQPRVAKNDASYVVGELIIALMRRGALSPPEGNALLLKLVKPDGLP